MADTTIERLDETHELIASDKVEGTAVYSPADEKLGTISHFMVDKQTGHVAYAVMSFGGFLGMGNSYHPLPWRALTYDVNRQGYVVDLTPDQLKGAPSYTSDTMPNWSDQLYGHRIDEYYEGTLGR
ncbi:PRC-barrel domain-containing protein [Gluconacetobacter takamatsuzukensis]|uniref:PRC-barrel domain-containing protein n=1 Tax=Gluconacetobacter takamatsuzukensis TaxID=1286190 RepID=A0A7W4KEH6_9PROT|nr:PRC-barrel domain-containing protein [Gluconacetobacter takamatsuzukensis]MBB2205453.1 PRC-barrel domain-containing protein [Gluconacetobacter takamatsuzukensis]